MDNDFTALAEAFNLCVRSSQVANEETGHLDEHAVDHNQQTCNKGTPPVDAVKLEQLSNTLWSRRSKRGHIKKKIELDPRRRTYP